VREKRKRWRERKRERERERALTAYEMNNNTHSAVLIQNNIPINES
jgi:hypothetical protein